MKLLRFCLILLLLSGAYNNAIATSTVLPDECAQLVVVTTGGWQALPGTLQRFERANGKWQLISNAFPVVVGRNGLAWGYGLHPAPGLPGPDKREGDGKSPAGIFKLSSAFGLPEVSEVKWIKLPYRHLTELIECVDDVKSKHYNLIVNRTNVSKVDWESSEKMKDYTLEYRLGVTVDHNTTPRVNGRGSCIFMHIWKGADKGTAGCTAMSSAEMEKLLRWLEPAKNPILVQLPEAEYKALQNNWGLPTLK